MEAIKSLIKIYRSSRDGHKASLEAVLNAKKELEETLSNEASEFLKKKIQQHIGHLSVRAEIHKTRVNILDDILSDLEGVLQEIPELPTSEQFMRVRVSVPDLERITELMKRNAAENHDLTAIADLPINYCDAAHAYYLTTNKRPAEQLGRDALPRKTFRVPIL